MTTDIKAYDLHSAENIQEFEKQDRLERYPLINSFDVMMEACRRHADKTALEFLPTAAKDEPALPVTYQQLAGRLIQTANLLHDLGVAPGDTVAMMLPTIPQTFYTIWGVQALGVINPLNPLLSVEHLSEIMAATTARALVVMAPIAGNEELWQKSVALAKACKSLKYLVVISIPGITEECPADIGCDVQVVDYSAAIDAQSPEKLNFERSVTAETPAAYMHTGGTTGRPKVASLSHGNIAGMGQMIADVNSNKQGTNTPGLLPMFHIFGLIVNGIGAFVSGYNVVILSPQGFRHPNVVEHFWAHVERFKFESFAAVPTILSVLYNVPVGDYDVSSLKEVLCGAAPLPNQLKHDFEDRFDCWVRNGYGMTETTCVLSISSRETPVPDGSCGLRVPYAERMVAHVEDGKIVRPCKANEVGAVLSRGFNIFAGYLEESDNRKAWIDDWFITGDMGYEDENGFLFLVGRSKDLIIRGGHNIDPVIIEEPLLSYPGVSEAVAVGQIDPHAGEVPVAFVVRGADSSVTEEELLQFARDNISEGPAVPKRIYFVSEIPLTAVGKMFKPRLREMAAQSVLESVLADANVEASLSIHTDQKRGLIVTLADEEQSPQARELIKSYPVVVEVGTEVAEPA